MVIIKDDDKLPLQWKKGVIQELITGRDNNVRGAVVRVIDNKGKIITLKRLQRFNTFRTCEKHHRRYSKRTAAVKQTPFEKVWFSDHVYGH